MPSLFQRLPPLRTLNRNLLLVVLTLLFWTVTLLWELVAVALDPWHVPGTLRAELESHTLLHVSLTPLLLLCYFTAVRIPRLLRHPLPTFLAQVLMAAGFASLPHVILYVCIYLITGDINIAGTHYRSLLEAGYDLHGWLPETLLSFMVYFMGLFLILGVNTRLDLENERIRTSNLHALWLNARLDTLRGQLNPHFLFNSLHTISSLLFTDTRRADKLLADFSDVLRITLREGQREFSTVREELDYARHYLSIEETRFEDRLKVHFSVDDGSLHARVPSLILQPLIENAIKHGISNCAGANAVKVEVRRGGDTLVMEVSNDFHTGNAPVAPEKKMGIGLKNVRERLMAIYGGDYTLSSLGLPGERWSTRISFPYQEAQGA
ncbi:MAG TPA: histidine kinase [Gammaproteobacteria bacterium]